MKRRMRMRREKRRSRFSNRRLEVYEGRKRPGRKGRIGEDQKLLVLVVILMDRHLLGYDGHDG
jgi:hypothetical protein